MKDGNKLEVLWGVIFLVGFVLTQYIFMSSIRNVFVVILWIVLGAMGLVNNISLGFRNKRITKMTINWTLIGAIALIGAILSFNEIYMFSIGLLGVIVFIVFGIFSIAFNIIANKSLRSIVGIIWVLAGIALFLIPALIPIQFALLGIFLGLPLIVYGIFLD